MYRAASIVLLAFLALVLSTPSLAEDYGLGRTVLVKLMDDWQSPDMGQLFEKNVDSLSSKDESYADTSERSLFSESGGEKDTVAYENKTDLYFRSHAFRSKIPSRRLYRPHSISMYKEKPKPFTAAALDMEFSSVIAGIAQNEVSPVGMAFLTNVVLHEIGHTVVADHVGAEGSSIEFFKSHNGQFFLGRSSVDRIDGRSKLPYGMGGAFAADLTFEYALQSYRKAPSLYNKSLLFFSGVDFLQYCIYAYYITDGHPSYDPVTISKTTGISKDVIFSAVLAKTAINAYRVYSGQDKVIPYFTVDKYSAVLNLRIAF